MLIEIKKQLVPNQNKYSFGKGNPCNYITIHETALASRGAGARNHANYQSNGNVGYGWHYQVDDKEVIQSYEDTYKVWNAGDGTGIGNTQSLSFEICVNLDSDFKKAVDNTAKAVAMKMKEHGIPLSNILQHYDHIGKNCPYNLRNNTKGISWQDFLNLVKKYRKQLDGKTESKPKQTNLILNPPKLAPVTESVYTVKNNDSFWSIAQNELGDGNKYKELAEFNGLNVNSVIHAGQKLKLPTANQRTYTVKKGDSLWLIAQRELGNGNLYPQIKTWNGLKSDHINIGDKLILKPNSRTYTVRKNDSFWSIAQNELGDGNRYKELADYNGLKTSHVLHVGDVLKLP